MLLRVSLISLKNAIVYKIALYARHVLGNTRPHQLWWGEWEMGIAISFTKGSQAAGLILDVLKNFKKHV